MSDLVSRLRDSADRIGKMCSELRPPKMRIPVTPDDDDVFICNALREAADRIEQLERENRDIKYIACQLGEDKLELERELAEAQQRIFDLEQAATDPEYRKRNPLGGPARMFDTIADRIRAGEDYHAVLKDYGLDAEARRDAERYRFIRSCRDAGFWQCHEKDGEGGSILRYEEDLDAATDKARGA